MKKKNSLLRLYLHIIHIVTEQSVQHRAMAARPSEPTGRCIDRVRDTMHKAPSQVPWRRV